MEKKDWKAYSAHFFATPVCFILFIYMAIISPRGETKLLSCTILPSSGHFVL